MHAQEVNQAMATNAAEELQAVIADQESELQPGAWPISPRPAT
jgi:hypothetical protein